MQEDAGGKDGWWRMKYMPEFGRFEFLSRELELRSHGDCFQCDRKREEEMKLDEVVFMNFCI